MRKTVAVAALGCAAVLGPVSQANATSHAPATAVTRVAAENTSDENSNLGKWGLAGLAGLLGLAGLAKAAGNKSANGSTRYDEHHR